MPGRAAPAGGERRGPLAVRLKSMWSQVQRDPQWRLPDLGLTPFAALGRFMGVAL